MADMAEALVQFGIAPVVNLRPEDMAKPQLSDLEALDNPHHQDTKVVFCISWLGWFGYFF